MLTLYSISCQLGLGEGKGVRYKKELLSSKGYIKAIYYVNENNQFDSLYTEYYKSGDKRMELNFKNGVRNGYCKTYFPGNILESIHFYNNGNVDSTFKWFYPNEMLRQKGDKKNGRTNGIVTSYYQNGALLSKVTWIEGLKSGETKEFYKNGQIKVYSYYNEGSLSLQIDYLEDGTIDNRFGKLIINLYSKIDNYKQRLFASFKIATPPNELFDLKIMKITPEGNAYNILWNKENDTYFFTQEIKNWNFGEYTFSMLLLEKDNIKHQSTFFLLMDNRPSIIYNKPSF